MTKSDSYKTYKQNVHSWLIENYKTELASLFGQTVSQAAMTSILFAIWLFANTADWVHFTLTVLVILNYGVLWYNIAEFIRCEKLLELAENRNVD